MATFRFFITVYFLVLLACQAQKVEVKELSMTIDNTARVGMSTVLELDLEFVEGLWKKHLKKYGSVKSRNGILYVEQATMPTITLSNVKVISKLEATDKGTTVWYSLDLGNAYVNASGDKTQYQEATKLLHDFGVSAYLADINEQIKEAERILSLSVKDQEKTISKGESLQNSIQKNRQEKTKLEQRLVDNAVEYKQLIADSVQNYQNQKFAAENVEKMKRAVEAVRAKVTKVE